MYDVSWPMSAHMWLRAECAACSATEPNGEMTYEMGQPTTLMTPQHPLPEYSL